MGRSHSLICIGMVCLVASCALAMDVVLQGDPDPGVNYWVEETDRQWSETWVPLDERPEEPMHRLAVLALPGDVETPAAQPHGALSNIIVFTSAGHGFTYIEANNNWRTQRPLLHSMVEDLGNLDQMNYFADYVFRAGATVIPFRPLGYQTNEVVLDNVDVGVTFHGTWYNSGSAIYYGNAAELPYRYAYINTTDITAWATYRPNLPEAGFYPVYAWTRHGSDRVRQLYRIEHSGGMTEVRVNHRRVGNGWVWLGTYYFESGTAGSVTIANHAPGENPSSNVIIADAIRFGNGMGDVARGSAGVSGFERELEASRYWVQRMVGQGMSSSLYDNPSLTDWNDNVGAPPRMAAEMNRQADGSFWDRIYVGFHSNADGGAGTARGPMGLWDNRGTTLKQDRQKDFGLLMANEIHADMTTEAGGGAFLDTYANNSANLYGSAYGEIYGAINDQMNSTIIETLFHNNATDANLLRDPVARRVMARSSYKAIVKHLHTNNVAVPLALLPEPPAAVSAVNAGPGNVTLRWTPPVVTAATGGAATGYVVYRSTDGYGFGNPVEVSGGGATSVTLTNVPTGQTLYYRVAARNAGGESLPSSVVAVRTAPSGQARHLIVNGFERNDRTQSPMRYFAHGLNGNVTLVRQRRINAFDYVVQHATALAAADVYFDSCDNTALIPGDVALTNYFAAYWILGRESTRTRTFTSVEQGLVQTFLQQEGRLFASGTDMAWDLDWLGTIGDRAFFTNYLKAAYAADDSGTFTVVPNTGGLFAGIASFQFDDGSGPVYRAAFPDVFHTRGGSVAALVYGANPAGTQIAGIAYDGTWKTVLLGFPFETILSENARNDVMARVTTDFFGPDPLESVTPDAPEQIWASLTNATAFTATWAPVTGATQYRLDVSTNATFAMVDGSGDYVVDFEGVSETKTGYASGTVALSGLDWNLTEALIGTLADDFKNGARSARMRGYGTSSMTMLADIATGLGTISFQYRRYGTDAQTSWQVEYSTTAGASWIPVGTSFTAPANDTVQEFTGIVNAMGNVRVRIREATGSGTSNRRLNIDDITLTPYPAVVSTPDFVPGYSNRLVYATSEEVSDLVSLHTYYFRVRAESDGGTSSNSPTGAVTTLDAPLGLPAVSFHQTRYYGEEGGPAWLIPVTLSYPDDATVQVAIAGTALPGGIDFTLSATTLVFSAAGSTTTNLLITIVDDELPEGPESALLTLVPGDGAALGDVPQTTLFIRDNDAFSIVSANLTSGGNQTYQAAGERIFQALCPDVVLLQEAKLPSGEFINRAWVDTHFGTNFHFFVEDEVGGSALPTAIVSRWPILAAGEWEADHIANRDYSFATIDLPGPRNLHAVSLHLLGSSTEGRVTSAQQLTNYIAQAGWPDHDYIVLGGDLNLQNRSEVALQILTNVVTDFNRPKDQDGNENTNEPRNRPYDFVLPNNLLDARHQPVHIAGYTFPFGLVFDTRLTWTNGLPPPAMAEDSNAENMQHMAVMKVYAFESSAAPPQAFAATAVGPDQVDLSWSLNAAGDDVIVVWNTSGSFTLPTGAPPAPGAPFAGGTVLYLGSASSFEHTGLNSCAAYYYRAWSVIGDDYSTGVSDAAVTAAPGGPSAIWITATNAHEVFVSWNAVSGAEAYALDVSATPTFSDGVAEPTVVFRETMGTVASTTAISTHQNNSGFDNTHLFMSHGGAANPADVRSTGTSGGYTDPAGNAASAGANIWFTTTEGERGFSIAGINSQGYDALRLHFGYRKEAAGANMALNVEWSTNSGAAWHPVAVSNLPPVNASVAWYMVSNLWIGAEATGSTNLALRWVKTEGSGRIDDVLLQGENEVAHYVSGYSNHYVSGTSHTITGLTADVTYYIRVRAILGECVTGDSPVASVTTLSSDTTAYTTTTPVPVPHAWLLGYFGEVDYESVANEMTTSGMYVWQEYVAGTDPTDPNSRLAAEVTRSSASPFHIIRWMGTDQPNRSYAVYAITNLWSLPILLDANIPSTHPAFNVYTDQTYHVQSPVYYRIEVTLDE